MLFQWNIFIENKYGLKVLIAPYNHEWNLLIFLKYVYCTLIFFNLESATFLTPLKGKKGFINCHNLIKLIQSSSSPSSH